MTTRTLSTSFRDRSRGWDDIVAGEKTEKYKSPDKDAQAETSHRKGKKKRAKQQQEKRRQERSR